jgi:hypothetical protein
VVVMVVVVVMVEVEVDVVVVVVVVVDEMVEVWWKESEEVKIVKRWLVVSS